MVVIPQQQPKGRKMKKTPQQTGEELAAWMNDANGRLTRQVILGPIGAVTLKLLESDQEVTLRSLIQALQSDLETHPGSQSEVPYQKALEHLQELAD